ncbi:MAG: hypothetical protein FWG53_07495 [Clostridiales bacterium]|nr:hypothetical protein [Clostridiales bacterium]
MKTGEFLERSTHAPAANDSITVSRVTFLGAGPHGQALSMGWPAPMYQMLENIIYGDTESQYVDKYEYSWVN